MSSPEFRDDDQWWALHDTARWLGYSPNNFREKLRRPIGAVWLPYERLDENGRRAMNVSAIYRDLFESDE
jgi:hypothetical protein